MLVPDDSGTILPMPAPPPDFPAARGAADATPDTIGVEALALALGTTRATILRGIDSGRLAPCDRPTIGGHRRWSVEAATALVVKSGRPVPASWTAAASTAGGSER